MMVFLGGTAFLIFSLIVLIKLEHKSRDVVMQTLLTALLSFGVMFLSAYFFNALFHSLKAGRLVVGGITWEGGVIGGFAAFLLLAHFLVKRERGRELELFSLVMPGVVLAHALGRVGCFLGGCCFGRITEGPLGVVFPAGTAAADQYPNTLTGEGSFPVLPTQLFEAIFELALFTVMLCTYRKLKHKNLAVYLIFYSVFRFVLEFWRGDNRGSTGIFLSPSQLMSLVLLAAGILVLLFQRRQMHHRRNAENHANGSDFPDPQK
ncbi:MAG: prolipoprotein diacylglyceryl transferase [Clostridia bacterium]|nr:prolipoprotein diacylglyceryl transferase [Clostridia bacterium]